MAQFDIFEVKPDSSLHWLAAEASMDAAEVRTKRLPPGEYVIIADGHSPKRISVTPLARQIIFQISYDDDKGATAREALFRSFGHEVVSVTDNDAAMRALASIANIDVFILGYTASEQNRKEMVDWLEVNFPKAKVIALIPSALPQLLGAEYNVPQSDWAAWVSLFATS